MNVVFPMNLRRVTLRDDIGLGNLSGFRSARGGGEGRGCRSVGTAAVGGGGVGLAAVVEFKADVVPDDAGGDIAGGDGEGDGVLARFQQRGIELLDVLVPDALVGVVAESVGGDGVKGADGLPVDSRSEERRVGKEC